MAPFGPERPILPILPYQKFQFWAKFGPEGTKLLVPAYWGTNNTPQFFWFRTAIFVNWAYHHMSRQGLYLPNMTKNAYFWGVMPVFRQYILFFQDAANVLVHTYKKTAKALSGSNLHFVTFSLILMQKLTFFHFP